MSSTAKDIQLGTSPWPSQTLRIRRGTFRFPEKKCKLQRHKNQIGIRLLIQNNIWYNNFIFLKIILILKPTTSQISMQWYDRKAIMSHWDNFSLVHFAFFRNSWLFIYSQLPKYKVFRILNFFWFRESSSCQPNLFLPFTSYILFPKHFIFTLPCVHRSIYPSRKSYWLCRIC